MKGGITQFAPHWIHYWIQVPKCFSQKAKFTCFVTFGFTRSLEKQFLLHGLLQFHGNSDLGYGITTRDA